MRVSQLMQVLDSMSDEEKLRVVTIVNHRAQLEACVESLISLFDIMDGDENLESDNDNEPSLGATENISQSDWYLPISADACDTELENEHYEDGGDTEPSCGWTKDGVLGLGDEEEESNGDEADTCFAEDEGIC